MLGVQTVSSSTFYISNINFAFTFTFTLHQSSTLSGIDRSTYLLSFTTIQDVSPFAHGWASQPTYHILFLYNGIIFLVLSPVFSLPFLLFFPVYLSNSHPLSGPVFFFSPLPPFRTHDTHFSFLQSRFYFYLSSPQAVQILLLLLLLYRILLTKAFSPKLFPKQKLKDMISITTARSSVLQYTPHPPSLILLLPLPQAQHRQILRRHSPLRGSQR
jgi:hypothetical protein